MKEINKLFQIPTVSHRF